MGNKGTEDPDAVTHVIRARRIDGLSGWTDVGCVRPRTFDPGCYDMVFNHEMGTLGDWEIILVLPEGRKV